LNFISDLKKLIALPPNDHIHTINDFKSSNSNYYLIYDKLKNFQILNGYANNNSSVYKYFSEEEISSIEE